MTSQQTHSDLAPNRTNHQHAFARRRGHRFLGCLRPSQKGANVRSILELLGQRPHEQRMQHAGPEKPGVTCVRLKERTVRSEARKLLHPTMRHKDDRIGNAEGDMIHEVGPIIEEETCAR